MSIYTSACVVEELKKVPAETLTSLEGRYTVPKTLASIGV
jgi:hypothetical protein